MTAQIDAWVAQAEKAAGEGRWAEAERLWGDVAKAAPDHGLALHRLGIHAFQRGAYVEAEAALARACTLIPQDPMVALNDSIIFSLYALNSVLIRGFQVEMIIYFSVRRTLCIYSNSIS